MASRVPAAMPDHLQPSDQGALSARIWLKSLGFSALIMLPWVLAGGLLTLEWYKEHVVESDSPNDAHAMWAWILLDGPCLLLAIVFLSSSGPISFKIGADVIQERSTRGDAVPSLKDAVVSAHTNIGVVLALFLSITVGMMQGGYPDGIALDGTSDILTRWYELLLMMATAFCIIGVMAATLTLVYLGPLSENAAKQFVVDNLNYLGLPLVFLLYSVFLLCSALQIWIHQHMGFRTSLYVALFLVVLLGQMMVMFTYYQNWENRVDGPTDERDRQQRRALAGTAFSTQATSSQQGHSQEFPPVLLGTEQLASGVITQKEADCSAC